MRIRDSWGLGLESHEAKARRNWEPQRTVEQKRGTCFRQLWEASQAEKGEGNRQKREVMDFRDPMERNSCHLATGRISQRRLRARGREKALK